MNKIEQLTKAASSVARAKRGGEYAYVNQMIIPRKDITELRRILTELGIEWGTNG